MFLWRNEEIDKHLDKLTKKKVEKTTEGRNKVGVTQNYPGCPIPAAVALLSAVGIVHPTGKVSALTIIQTRNQRTEQFWMSSHSGSLGPSQGREVGHADSRSGEKDLNPPLSPYYLPLALNVQLTLETSPSLGNKPSSTSK